MKCRQTTILSSNTRLPDGRGHRVDCSNQASAAGPVRKQSVRNLMLNALLARASPARVETICRFTFRDGPRGANAPGSLLSTRTSGCSPDVSEPVHVDKINSAPGRWVRTDASTRSVSPSYTGPWTTTDISFVESISERPQYAARSRHARRAGRARVTATHPASTAPALSGLQPMPDRAASPDHSLRQAAYPPSAGGRSDPRKSSAALTAPGFPTSACIYGSPCTVRQSL